MDWGKFQLLAEKAGIRPVSRWKTKYGNICIGERIARAQEGTWAGKNRPWCIQTLWFIERDGCDIGKPVQYPVHTPLSEKERVREALDNALEDLGDMLHAGVFEECEPRCIDHVPLIPWSIDESNQTVTGGIFNGAVHG